METTTTENTNTTQNYQLEFFGKGADYFSIMIVNWLLTLVTAGLYYPWARAKRLNYIYSQTALNNERFHFAGTGNEMFRGFIKIILFYILIMGAYFLISTTLESPFLAILVVYLAIFAIIPFAVHGSFRYKMSRTSYRGIRFGYRGNRNELIKNYVKWVVYTIISFGIYGAWLQMNIRRYTHQHIRYSDVEFSNDADGGEYFLMNLKGYLLTIITLGIYVFWWECDIFNYYIDKMKMSKGEQKIECHSTATGGGFFSLLIVNLLITVFTLGFGKAWADMRTQKFICDNVKMEGDINLDEIHQTEEEYTDAFGEDAMDFFEIDLA
ncbi:MAG: YjgN family protein [Bacteroidia bacterium]